LPNKLKIPIFNSKLITMKSIIHDVKHDALM